jgi:hypothetical protein
MAAAGAIDMPTLLRALEATFSATDESVRKAADDFLIGVSAAQAARRSLHNRVNRAGRRTAADRDSSLTSCVLWPRAPGTLPPKGRTLGSSGSRRPLSSSATSFAAGRPSRQPNLSATSQPKRKLLSGRGSWRYVWAVSCPSGGATWCLAVLLWGALSKDCHPPR